MLKRLFKWCALAFQCNVETSAMRVFRIGGPGRLQRRQVCQHLIETRPDKQNRPRLEEIGKYPLELRIRLDFRRQAFAPQQRTLAAALEVSEQFHRQMTP